MRDRIPRFRRGEERYWITRFRRGEERYWITLFRLGEDRDRSIRSRAGRR